MAATVTGRRIALQLASHQDPAQTVGKWDTGKSTAPPGLAKVGQYLSLGKFLGSFWSWWPRTDVAPEPLPPTKPLR